MRSHVRSRRRLVLSVAAMALLVGACGDGFKETVTVYQDAPTMNPVDVGPPGTSAGDAFYFSANLHDRPGGPTVGQVFGTKTLVRPADSPPPDAEQRATLLFFTFGDGDDQIVVAGIPDYPTDAPEFEAGVPVLRAVMGGTGKYIGARGQLTSTRNADGTYRQEFTLQG